MTRCKELYDKVEREGFDWCEKDKTTVSRINTYLKVVKELSDEGVEKKLTYGNFSENASRPLQKVEDPDIRGEVISLIAKAILRGDSPSAADLKVWIELASGIDPVTKSEKSDCNMWQKSRCDKEACEKSGKTSMVNCKLPTNTCPHWSGAMCHASSDIVLSCTPENHKTHNCTLEPMCPPTPAPAHGILAICRVRNKGEPCENLDANDTGLEWCTVEKKCPGFMIACPMEIAAKVAHVPVEQIRPSDKTGPFTPASEIPKGLVDLNAPDTRTDPVPFTPVHPIARTDPLDKANGVVKMQKATDYETLAKEGDMYPLSKLKARVMNQMVEYGLAADNLDASALYDKEGPHIWLGKIDGIIDQEGDSHV